MALRLFPTPVDCKNCGTIVDDSATGHCPNCGRPLRERRTPRRLAGVEPRHENLRLLLGFVRFLGVITASVGILIFLFADASVSLVGRVLTMLGAVLVGTGLFVVAALIEIVADLEENTRATFRIQQSLLDEVRNAPPGQ